ATSRSSACAPMAKPRAPSLPRARASSWPSATIRPRCTNSSPTASPPASCTCPPPPCATPRRQAPSTYCRPSRPCCPRTISARMPPTLRRKLEALADRRDELERLLADPAVAGDQDRFRALSREFSRLEPLATAMADQARARADLEAAQEMCNDPELRDLAEEEIAAAQARLDALEEQLMALLVPRDARDDGG